MSLTIQIPRFEGPLDLLLYLIRKEEMDIFDIKINQITKQYLEYVKLLKELDLEVAGEFIAMSATLIHIKSRLLLPQYNEQGEVIEQEDPRKELVQKLIEYQKYKEAAQMLYERPLVGRDVWLRGTREVLKADEEEIILEENALFSLISAYRGAMKSFKKKVHKVSAKLQSIAARILEIRERLVVGQRTTMSDVMVLSEEKAKMVLITFLSLLELGKLGFVRLFQPDTFGEIYIDPMKNIETDVISRVEEFDNVQSEEVLQRLTQTPVVNLDDDFALDDFSDEANAVNSMGEGAQLSLSAAAAEGASFHIEGLVAQEIDAELASLGSDEIASDDDIALAEKELNL